jgi:2-polyprenyl-3-methyl-5-hydroxy-6-metoxy-1,4-benzoquinol methylase
VKASTGRYGTNSFTDSALERERLGALAAVFDPYSTRHLDALAPAAGWRCLDIGPGAGTITRWLASRVAPGEVVGVDRDTIPFGNNIPGNVTLLERDVTHAGALPQLGQFDLIHARAVLMHLPERIPVLRSLTTLVRPGGQIMITDIAPAPCRALASDAMDLMWTQAARLAGTDPDWARTFPAPIAECGLVDIEVAVDVPILRGGSSYARFLEATVRQLITGDGSQSPSIDAYLSLLNDPDYLDWPAAMITTWGRRPPTTQPT